MGTIPPVVAAFQRAAREVPAYRTILAEHHVDPTQITSLGAFQDKVPRINKADTFGRFPLAELCRGGQLGKPAWILTSSGHSGQFAYGMYGEENADEATRRVDDALDYFLGVRSKSTLLINCLPMGVKVYTQACTLAETSVREDMVVALVEAFGGHYEQIILVGETAFIKRVLELGESKHDENYWHRRPPLVHLVVGEETLAENARTYLGDLLGIKFDKPETGQIFSSMGVAELGLNLFWETRPLIALRRALHRDADLRESVFGPGARSVPMIFAYDPEWIFPEVLKDGRLAISTLDSSRRIPLIRYLTGDIVRHLEPSDALWKAAGLKGDELGQARILLVHGRGQGVRVGSRLLFPEDVKEALYADPELARNTTANFQLRRNHDTGQVLLDIQLQLGFLPDASLEERYRKALGTYSDAQIGVQLVPYYLFTSGMSLDYERKFAYVERAAAETQDASLQSSEDPSPSAEAPLRAVGKAAPSRGKPPSMPVRRIPPSAKTCHM
jgi:phenylacetate-CoA ligase